MKLPAQYILLKKIAYSILHLAYYHTTSRTGTAVICKYYAAENVLSEVQQQYVLSYIGYRERKNSLGKNERVRRIITARKNSIIFVLCVSEMVAQDYMI